MGQTDTFNDSDVRGRLQLLSDAKDDGGNGPRLAAFRAVPLKMLRSVPSSLNAGGAEQYLARQMVAEKLA
jgi:hypothetical protein